MQQQHAPCTREDLISAFDDVTRRLQERRAALWDAYLGAGRDMSPREYEECEVECWNVLHAGLAGLDAEQRMLQRDFEERLTSLDGRGVAV